MMLADTPIVVQVRSPSVVSSKTRVTAPVPRSDSSTRTLKSVRWRRARPGWASPRASRSAASRALTGPFPSPVAIRRSSPTQILTVASVSMSTVTSFQARAPLPDLWPTLTSNDSNLKKSWVQPAADRISSSREASAASKW